MGADSWVVEVLRWGYRVPFRSVSPLSSEPIPFPAYTPVSIRGKALAQEVLSQAVSSRVAFASSDTCLSYIPEFLAKTECSSNPLPRSFVVKSLSDFAAGLTDDLLLCPVRALRRYLRRTSSIQSRPRCVFVSPRSPSRAMSKNGISYFLREVICEAGACREVSVPIRVHNIKEISTSTAFFKNWSVSSVLTAASWRSNSVFAAFHLRDLHCEYEGLRSLGPFVAACKQIG